MSNQRPMLETSLEKKPVPKTFSNQKPMLETPTEKKSVPEILSEQQLISEPYLDQSKLETSSNQKSVFETLFEINVNNHTEQKNGLSYLSWPFAWAEVKKKFPDANYTVYENSSGFFYHTDGKTCWVKTGVTIDGLEHIEYLPVMDYRNRSITFENITSFDVNKAIQRSLTKSLARHGLGLYVYAGEDLPEIEVEKISPLKATNLKHLLVQREDEQIYQKVLKNYKIQSLRELTVKQYSEIVNRLKSFEVKKHKKSQVYSNNFDTEQETKAEINHCNAEQETKAEINNFDTERETKIEINNFGTDQETKTELNNFDTERETKAELNNFSKQTVLELNKKQKLS